MKKRIMVAICDDNEAFMDATEKQLKRVLKKFNIHNKIDKIITTGDLLDEHIKEKYDLIFLDMEFAQGDIKGINAARYIRDELYDETVKIIYVSANTQYAMQLFETRPINFLEKPIVYGDLEKAVEVFLRLSGHLDLKFTYTVNKTDYCIDYADIMYFKSENRKIIIVTKNYEKTEFYGVMGDVWASAKKARFMDVHRSYIVNRDYIKSFTYNHIIMTNGASIPIGRSKQKEIRRMLMGKLPNSTC